MKRGRVFYNRPSDIFKWRETDEMAKSDTRTRPERKREMSIIWPPSIGPFIIGVCLYLHTSAPLCSSIHFGHISLLFSCLIPPPRYL